MTTGRGLRWVVVGVGLFMVGAIAGAALFSGASGPEVSGPAAPVPAAAGSGRDEQGAVAAAVRYASWLPELLVGDPDRVKDAVGEMAADERREAAIAAVDSGLALVQSDFAVLPGTPLFRQQVLAVRVDHIDDNKASVAVWTMQLAGATGLEAAPQATFSTMQVVMTWERDAWRLWSTSSAPGPQPALVGQPTLAAEFVPALDGFKDWRP